MAKKLILREKIYNFDLIKDRLKMEKEFLQYLNEFKKDFPKTTIQISKFRNFDNRFEISVDGPDQNFVTRILEKEIGVILEFDKIKEGTKLQGNMIEIGNVGFGIFVDCGIINPAVDVLINLHKLRKQLADNKKVSIKRILKAYDFVEFFPINLTITEKDEIKMNLQGEISPESVNLFHKIINRNIECIFINGATQSNIEVALRNKNHARDISKIENYGFLEHIIYLKRNTNAIGIISEIGGSLEGSKMSALIPKRIKKLLK